jgi:hypothetical protein
MPNDTYPLLETAFFGVLHKISYGISVLLTLLTSVCIVYQLYALYGPYWFSKISSKQDYRFPEYFYRVYGDEQKDLESEHYGYLFAAVVAVALNLKLVVFNVPKSSTSTTSANTGMNDILELSKSVFGKIRGAYRVVNKMVQVAIEEAKKED